MSKEILDAIGVVAYEKGIDPEILFTALEDALLAAYRKTSHAKPFARVEFDRETGDIRVFTLMLSAEELEGHPGVTYPEPEPPAEGEPLPLEPVASALPVLVEACRANPSMGARKTASLMRARTSAARVSLLLRM